VPGLKELVGRAKAKLAELWRAYLLIFFKPYIFEAHRLLGRPRVEDRIGLGLDLDGKGKGRLVVAEGRCPKRGTFLVFLPKEKCGSVITMAGFPLLAHNVKGLRQRPLLFPLAVALTLLAVLITAPHAHDDLFRHLRSGDVGFDYTRMYLMEWFFSFEIYPLWDRLYSLSYHMLGDGSIALWEFLSALAFSLSFALLTRGMEDEKRAFLYLLGIALLGLRVILARPASFIAFLVPLLPYIGRVWAFLLALFAGVSYYLFPLYLLPFLDRKEVLLAFLLSLLFWLWWSHGAYFAEVAEFLKRVATEREGIIGENLGYLFVSQGIPYTLMLALALISALSLFPKPLSLRILYFLALNQGRFLDSLILLTSKAVEELKVAFFSPSIMALSVILLLISPAYWSYGFGEMVDVKKAREVFGSLSGVVGLSTDYAFLAVYVGPVGKARYVPPMEIALTKEPYGKVLEKLEKGNASCGELALFDYIVEESLTGSPPPCLELVGLYREARIWKVEPR